MSRSLVAKQYNKMAIASRVHNNYQISNVLINRARYLEYYSECYETQIIARWCIAKCLVHLSCLLKLGEIGYRREDPLRLDGYKT